MDPAADVMVRTMVARDACAVARLAGQLGYVRSDSEVEAWIAQSADARQRQVAFVACLGDEVVGWIEVSIMRHVQSAPHGLIGGLVVRDDLRSVGVGRRLLERAEAWAWEQGVDEMVVTSRSTRVEAHRFYLRDGYTRLKTSEVFAKHGQGSGR